MQANRMYLEIQAGEDTIHVEVEYDKFDKAIGVVEVVKPKPSGIGWINLPYSVQFEEN